MILSHKNQEYEIPCFTTFSKTDNRSVEKTAEFFDELQQQGKQIKMLAERDFDPQTSGLLAQHSFPLRHSAADEQLWIYNRFLSVAVTKLLYMPHGTPLFQVLFIPPN